MTKKKGKLKMATKTMTMVSVILLVTIFSFNSSVMAWDSIYNIVDDYGAAGDGVTDDTNEIQNAIDAAYDDGGGTVYVPQGKFKVTSTIVLKDKVIMKGIGIGEDGTSGASGSVVYVSGDICGINVTGDQAGINGIRVHGDNATNSSKIDYDGNAPSALVFIRANRFNGGRIAVECSRGTGLHFYEGNCSTFQSILAFDNRSHGVYIKGDGSSPNANASWFGLIDSRINHGDGVNIDNCFNNAFGQIVAQGNSGDGVEINSDWHSILNVYCEANTGDGLKFGAQANYNMVHQYIDSGEAVTDSGSNNSVFGFATGATSAMHHLTIGQPVFCPYSMDSDFGGQLELTKESDGYYYLKQTGSSGDRRLCLDGGTGELNLATKIVWLNGKSIQMGSAAPASGTYTAGEIIFNSAPTSGGYIGWVCTSGGSPGTWKTFGKID